MSVSEFKEKNRNASRGMLTASLPSVSCGPVCGCSVSVYVHVLRAQMPRGPPRTSANMSTLHEHMFVGVT